MCLPLILTASHFRRTEAEPSSSSSSSSPSPPARHIDDDRTASPDKWASSQSPSALASTRGQSPPAPLPPLPSTSVTAAAANTSANTTATVTATATTSATSSHGAAAADDDSKRAVAKKLIERYFYQLSVGCGNPTCSNHNCASSGGVAALSANQAAARAIQLYTQEAQLCNLSSSKIALTPRGDDHQPTTPNGRKSDAIMGVNVMDKEQEDEAEEEEEEEAVERTLGEASSSRLNHPVLSRSTNAAPPPPSSSSSRAGYTGSSSILPSSLSAALRNATAQSIKPLTPSSTQPKPDDYLDEEKLARIIDDCKRDDCYASLIRAVGRYFGSRQCLAASFRRRRRPGRQIDMTVLLERSPADLKNLKKEDFRTLEGDLDKDEDDTDDVTTTAPTAADAHYTGVDVASVRRAMQRLYEAHMVAFESINTAVHSLAIGLTVDLQFNLAREQIEEVIHVFVVIFEVIAVWSADFMDHALPTVCRAVALLPVWAQARLACIWAEHCRDSLQSILHTVQQLISLQVIAGSDDAQHFFVQDNEQVVWATKVMKIIYYANLLAGQMEPSRLRDGDGDDEPNDPDAMPPLSAIPEDEELFYGYNVKQRTVSSHVDDALATELNINLLDCRRPLLPFEEFYNEPLSDAIEMDNDYLNYKNRRVDQQKFSFMLYSFILTPATKTLALYYDNRIRMYSERRISIFHTELAGQPQNPYLKLKVRRDQIIDDALIGLEVVAMGNPKDLKKQLVVEFVGEQGIDEGGVSKEFFQLVVEQIFNADFGMFVPHESTNMFWFNSTSFENEAQFTLIGIVLGLAIYNNIILAVNFPMVVYRKLMGIRGSFADLADWNPELHRSLASLLAYEEPDMEDMFMLTFRISYADVFGNVMTHDLRPDGDSIAVGQYNKQEFVDLYTDYLLNTSIEKQFRSFRRGFQMVTDESPLQLLFRPEEIELLVCGSKQFDFNALEKATEYEGGFTDKSPTIVDFWDIVHALPMESKKKLLEFTTGSDRVPVGGLSRLKLMIARNGPDSDRLPTSHTCFNVLLLPEYSDKDKLKDRLLKAINYSKGFGML